MKYLALDSSSTTIGWALMDNAAGTPAVRFCGTHKLAGKNIVQRVEDAYQFVLSLLRLNRVSLVVVESPASRFNGALIPQCRVGGAIILACAHSGVPWSDDVTPAAAKKALTGKGTAKKDEMLRAAAPLLRFDADNLVYTELRGTWVALLGDEVVFDEHRADAVAVGLAVRPVVGE